MYHKFRLSSHPVFMCTICSVDGWWYWYISTSPSPTTATSPSGLSSASCTASCSAFIAVIGRFTSFYERFIDYKHDLSWYTNLYFINLIINYCHLKTLNESNIGIINEAKCMSWSHLNSINCKHVTLIHIIVINTDFCINCVISVMYIYIYINLQYLFVLSTLLWSNYCR